MITFTIVAIIGLVISFVIIKKWMKWNKIRKSQSLKFKIPVGNLTLEEKYKSLQQTIDEYKQEVKFDEETGEIKLPFKHIKIPQEYWLGTPADDASPEIETLK